MTLKLGYKAAAEQFAPRLLLDFSVAAEHAGFDSVFVSDHFQPWRHTDGHAPSALAWSRSSTRATRRRSDDGQGRAVSRVSEVESRSPCRSSRGGRPWER